MATTQPTLLGRSSSYLRMTLSVAALCWATPRATAGMLPPTNPNLPAPLIYVQPPSGDADARYSLVPDPSVDADAYIKPGVTGSAGGAYVDYDMVVAGPPGVPVPLTISSSVGYFVSGAIDEGNELYFTYWQASALVSLDVFSGKGYPGSVVQSISGGNVYGVVGQYPGEYFATVDKPVTVYVTSGILHDIYVYAGVDVDQGFANMIQPPPNVCVHAFADPVISFAPGFDSTGFTLEFSPGIGNASVPEPSTFVMSSILFGMYGAVWAYRRLKQAPIRTTPTRPAGLYGHAEAAVSDLS